VQIAVGIAVLHAQVHAMPNARRVMQSVPVVMPRGIAIAMRLRALKAASHVVPHRMPNRQPRVRNPVLPR
jgi:hypothetical protein